MGRGQIADLPTAITELWKNGYDAYADTLTAEIFKKEFTGLQNDLFLLTDDGKGMSQRDIFEKWLVLGTDSKTRAQLEEKADIETLWKEPRIKAGEKGIGRLSVAFLGNPMLMLTKKIGSPVQMLFFDWRLLQNYNLYLDDINIPVEGLNGESDFQQTFIKLKKSFLDNLKKEKDLDGNLIWEEGSQIKLREIIKDSVSKALLSDHTIEILLKDFTDIENSYGTKFLIFEPIDQILELAEARSNDNEENRDFTISSLSGFFNPFIKVNPKKEIKTYLYVHQITGKDKDLLIGEGSFFDEKDYDLADILIEGKFTGYGKFTGKLNIYGKNIDYEYEPSRKKFKKKYYGDFYIKLGYNQGRLEDSKLNDTAYKKINDKVTRYGGLYLYRDDFRVLPYGRPNADFLKFEERRNRRIGTYYFSYRRMFGYIGITRASNPDLQDKSSREGLINNDPYSAFELDLIGFFIQVAKDYFADHAEQSIFLDEKKKLNEQHKSIEEDKKRETQEKKAFSRSLSAYPERFKSYEKKYRDVLNKLSEKLLIANSTYSDIGNLLDELQELDLEFEQLLPEIPKRYKPTDLQLDRLNKYEEQIVLFNRTIKGESAEIMEKVNEKLELHELKVSFSKNAEVYQNKLESLLDEHYSILKNKFNSLSDEYKQRSVGLIQEFLIVKQSSEEKILSKNDIKEQSKLLKMQFDRLKETANQTLIPLTEHISRMSFDIDEELLQGAYKAQYEQMRQQWSLVQDTAQLGIAVEIIDHEFNVLYSRINLLLSGMNKSSAFNSNKDYLLLETAFRSLEDKYNLLSPLYRINTATTKDIPGQSLVEYIQDFFGKQLESENVVLTASPSFLKHKISLKEPVLYTVVINIVNNAIYWMLNSEKKEIKFDYLAKTNEILILNSGKKIEEHRLSKIFDLFYSNRPSGRGIGLYLAKQSLNESGYEIKATNDPLYNIFNGACFIITPNP